MVHKTVDELNQMLNDARSKVKVGGSCYHYKHFDRLYTLVDVVIIEATEEIAVLYRAEYEGLKGITFMRPIQDFLAEVEVNNQIVSRFTFIN